MACYKVKLAKDDEEAQAWLQTVQQEGFILVKKHCLLTTRHDARTFALATITTRIYLLNEKPEENPLSALSDDA